MSFIGLCSSHCLSRLAPPTCKFVWHFNFSLLEHSDNLLRRHLRKPSFYLPLYSRCFSGLQAIYHQFVSMHVALERIEVKYKFYEIAHFPGVVGLVDGTHIRIQKPSEIEANYINRYFTTQLTSKLLANRMERLVMYRQVSLGLFTFQEFGNFRCWDVC